MKIDLDNPHVKTSICLSVLGLGSYLIHTYTGLDIPLAILTIVLSCVGYMLVYIMFDS